MELTKDETLRMDERFLWLQEPRTELHLVLQNEPRIGRGNTKVVGLVLIGDSFGKHQWMLRCPAIDLGTPGLLMTPWVAGVLKTKLDTDEVVTADYFYRGWWNLTHARTGMRVNRTDMRMDDAWNWGQTLARELPEIDWMDGKPIHPKHPSIKRLLELGVIVAGNNQEEE